jgi:acetyltransferase
MGGGDVAAGAAILTRADIPTFPYPDSAARVFTYMWRYSRNLRALYETPTTAGELGEGTEARRRVDAILQNARGSARTILSETESKQVLAAYGIPTVESRIAHSEDEAVAASRDLGFPVVLKLHSETITHKTDVGGVRLNLHDDSAVQDAFRAIRSAITEKAGAAHFQGVSVQPMVRLDGTELILGSSLDPQFGPVLLFGSGGQLVEVHRDRALALPPLTTTLARRLIEKTKAFTVLQGVRGRRPVDLHLLEQLVVRFSQLVVEHPWIKEVDINPLLASADRLVALDARIIVHGPDVSPANLPTPAIRPYPTRYVVPWKLRNGTSVTIRPIRPEDEPLMVRFHETLSDRSVYFRYFHLTKLHQRVAHERLTRICFIDYDREMALVAERENTSSGQPDIVGVGRLTKGRGRNEAEFALLVGDPFQGQGLGTELLKRVLQVARDEKIERVFGDILAENLDMRRVVEKVGFSVEPTDDPNMVRAKIALG